MRREEEGRKVREHVDIEEETAGKMQAHAITVYYSFFSYYYFISFYFVYNCPHMTCLLHRSHFARACVPCTLLSATLLNLHDDKSCTTVVDTRFVMSKSGC